MQQVGISLAERDREQWVIRLALAGGGGLGLTLTVLGAFFLTGRALAPVEASMDRQRRFISDASHELRTPLALLRLEVEGEPAITSEQRRPLLQQIDRLARMVGDLLLLARLDEGELPLEREPVAVDGLLRTAAAEARRLAPEARVSVEGATDLWVSGDADRLHQVVLVLVDNAARVTPPGGAITLRARLDGDEVVLSVRDGGPGVPEEHAASVFDRFYRVDKARARTHGGAGLGLSIARDIVRRHGGELRLDNPGVGGAIFSIRLPRLDAATAAVLAPAIE
jgi:signal transduction histidine kinase